MNHKRKFSPYKPKWRKEDSDLEDDSPGLEEEEDSALKDLEDLLRELLTECRRLSTLLQNSQSIGQIIPHSFKN